MRVYLLWQNDGVLGVFATEDLARTAAAEHRLRLGGVWRSDTPDYYEAQRWHQPQGPVARLEIDPREVHT